ncbi:MAG TPA: penicillin-binding protein 1C [Anaerolineales bacterium]|nr:penicillin-binding protein 1C [Anaerolineales bacterium]
MKTANTTSKKHRLWWLLIPSIAIPLWLYLFYDLPSINSLSENLAQPSVRITDRNGVLLYDLLPQVGGRQVSLAVENIPQCMRDATVAVEDANFYSHPGVDLVGILRAVWINTTSGETVSGGSTITQQLARILLFDEDERTERSLRRKIREAVLAWQLTQRYSKDEILALYLNQSYYGGMAYGIEAAAQTYFNKSASDLILPECALLAGLTQTPGLYNPYTNPDLAIERQKVVLGLMEKHGFISSEEKAEAEKMPMAFNQAPYPMEAPHFIWLIKDRLDEMFLNGELNPHESLIIRTTLDVNMQHTVEAVARQRIESFQRDNDLMSRNVNNAAVVVIDPSTGDVLALMGSVDYFNEEIRGAINMAAFPRQTGSAFKPFIYALALAPNHPQPWTAGTAILDVSTNFVANDGAIYTPVNYDGKEHGFVSVREALASSLNVPAVKTLEKVGLNDTIGLAQQLGITTLDRPDRYDLSLALGGGEVSLLELTTAYSVLAHEGVYVGRRLILSIENANGQVLFEQEAEQPVQVISPQVTWLISDILSDDQARSRTFGLNSALRLDRPAAVKTGTTTNFYDNWTIGYTPSLTVGVWVGNSTFTPMQNVTGLTGAGPIWHDVMRAILEGHPEESFVQPEGLEQVEICALSGLLPTEYCRSTRKEWFIQGTAPSEYDTFYKEIILDNGTPMIVYELPVEAQAWARSQGMPLLEDFQASSLQESQPLILSSPAPNSTYVLYSHLDPATQQIPIQMLVGEGITQVTVWVDGSLFATLNGTPYEAWWQLSIGTHQIWAEAVDGNGKRIKTDVVTVNVLSE